MTSRPEDAVGDEERAAAIQRILDAEPMPVPGVEELKAELADARGRRMDADQ